jgi:hypothetical protein
MTGALGFPEGFWEWPIERRQAWHDAHPEAFSPIEDPRTPKRIGNGQPPPNLGEEQPTKPSRNTRAAHKRFELLPFDKIVLDATPTYLVKGIVPRVGLCVFWGPPKCGKSFLVFDLMMHIALGWKYRDRKVRQGAVVYCALEGCTAFKNRVEAFRQAKLPENVGEVPFHLMASPMQLVADHPALIASIREQAATPAALVIDTLNRSLTGSESSDEDMSAYVKAADAIRDALGCVVIIVHHCGHEGTRPRGHSSLIGAVDAQIAVKRDGADNIIATIEHMKDGAQGDEFTSRLEVVEAGADDDDDPITSCVVVPVEGLAPSRKDKAANLTKGAKIALDALHEAVGDCGVIPPASNHIPGGVKCVTIDRWREHALRRGISTSDKESAIRMAFVRATESLVAARRVAIWDGHAWPT